MKSILCKALRPNDKQKSRLHDQHGNLVPLSRLVFNGPRALVSWLSLKIAGRRAMRPWISYAATQLIERRLRSRPCSVLEFGSGMSTLWFSGLADRLFSIENDERWYETVSKQLKKIPRPANGLDYRFESEREKYARFVSDEQLNFDIMLFDGPWRADCIKNNLGYLAPGGILYLDNSDADTSSSEPGEIAEAVTLFEQFAGSHGVTVISFTDFSPASCFATQGLMIKLPDAKVP